MFQRNQYILIIKLNGCTNFSNLFWNKILHVLGQVLCPPTGIFHCAHNNGIYHTGLLTEICTSSWFY